jgi:ATP adenylyltransferase
MYNKLRGIMKRLWAPWRMEYILAAQEDEDGCLFCEKPQEKNDEVNLIVHRSQKCFVMLNRYPYNNGHLMVIPYLHECDLTKLSDEILLNMQHTLNLCIKALTESIHPHGINVGINLGRTAGAGIEEHLHYHLVPRWNGDTNFMPVLSDTKVVSEALDQTWKKLKKAFTELIERG